MRIIVWGLSIIIKSSVCPFQAVNSKILTQTNRAYNPVCRTLFAVNYINRTERVISIPNLSVPKDKHISALNWVGKLLWHENNLSHYDFLKNAFA